MGYYNIFRIIRQTLKDLLGYKNFRKLLIIIVILIFVLFFTKRVYGFTNDKITITNVGEITLNSWYDNYYWIIVTGLTNNRPNMVRIVSDQPIELYYQGNKIYSSTPCNFNRVSSGVGSTQNKLYNYNYIINTAEPSLTYNSSSFQAFYDFDLTYDDLQIFSNYNVYFTNGNSFNNVTNPRINYPILTNSISDLETLNLDSFNVELKDFSNEDVYMLFFNRSLSNPNNTDGLYATSTKILVPQSPFYNADLSTSSNGVYNIPIWRAGLQFYIENSYEIRFAVLRYNQNNEQYYDFIGDTYSFTISSSVRQDFINQINQESSTNSQNENFENLENSINNQTNAINNQTNSINNINNSITDSTVDSSSVDLPSDTTVNPTQSGIDNIFTTIYNNFTSGQAPEVVFPIPFTNKSITLNPNYLSNALQSNNAGWIITFIQAFWWFIISRFIIKDIASKIRKIKQGNFENIQNSNIKEDML